MSSASETEMPGTYAATRARLRECMRTLSLPDLDLDEVVHTFEEACVLLESLEVRLQNARLRITEISDRHLRERREE
jgi:exodeoxyribonuclease VII small subunit